MTDVVDATGISIAAGWGDLERYAGETFRWISGEASFDVQPSNRDRVVSVRLENGPGVGHDPLQLEARSTTDATVQRFTVAGRDNIEVKVGAMHRPATITLRAMNGGRRVPEDPRVLDFRIFSLSEKK